ncbi:MAG: hypothetical protein ACQKBT_01300, partial [Puniceicoccales bacterium]
MKRTAATLSFIILGLLAAWIYNREDSPPEALPATTKKPIEPAPPSAPHGNPRNPTSPLARQINRVDHSPQKNLEIVYTLLAQT